MYKFSREQKTFEIGGIKIGDQSGALPTVMIGSIFYRGDKLVVDEKKGTFDERRAEELLKREERISERTGNPRMIDVCGENPKALIKHIGFVAGIVDSPFLIDGPTSDVRIAATKYVEEAGLSDRAIYNSLTPEAKPEEIEIIREVDLDSAVLLAVNTKNPTLNGRMEVLDKLLGMAEDASIGKPLVDTCILDLPDPGPATKAIYLIKEKYGLPAGCGAHNAIDRWDKNVGLDERTKLIGTAIANAFPIMAGADFVLYGPIDEAERAYKECTLADAYVAYSLQQEFGLMLSDEHPLFRVFRKPAKPPD